jgi:hypothetical protein
MLESSNNTVCFLNGTVLTVVKKHIITVLYLSAFQWTTDYWFSVATAAG